MNNNKPQQQMIFCFVVFLSTFLFVAISSPVAGQSNQNIEIAVALSLSGDGTSFGQPALEGIQLAIEEHNMSDAAAKINLVIYDDKSSDNEAAAIAQKIIASDAWLTLGPSFSTASLSAGSLYADANMVSLPPSATSDLITQNKSTFRVVFKNSDQGEILATYLVRVLKTQRAAVFVVDTAYGNTLREGFERIAKQLELDAEYYVFSTDEEGEALAQRYAEDNPDEPVVFLTLDPEGAKILAVLRRAGITGPFLGGDAFGDESFGQRFAEEPEEQTQHGFFTNNLYGLAPVILDSANADTLAFADRFQAKFGHEAVWMAVAGYDAAVLAIAAIQNVITAPNAPTDLSVQRAAIVDYMNNLDSPQQAQVGLLGPFWFDAEQARPQGIRIGRFYDGRFESAPLQIVPVTTPDRNEINAGSVFEVSNGRYARLQRVVYTGVFINEIPRIDLSQANYDADFYLWLRFAQDAGEDPADPTNLLFPGMISGSFDSTNPVEQRQMPDGTEYYLWRIQGKFRNDFDLRRFPFDEQQLLLSFSNAVAPMEKIVYVVDRRAGTADLADPAINPQLSIAASVAFRNLTQWDPLSANARRENLVTDSSLGDPTRVGVESERELSGFVVSVELERRTVATLAKTLLPLLLLTFIMYASLFFPAALVKEKVTVAITGALSGAVLLTAINTQLGSVGYTIAVEYIFYIFFGLCLLCILAVLIQEQLRAANRVPAVTLVERITRIIFLVVAVATPILVAVVFG